MKRPESNVQIYMYTDWVFLAKLRILGYFKIEIGETSRKKAHWNAQTSIVHIVQMYDIKDEEKRILCQMLCKKTSCTAVKMVVIEIRIWNFFFNSQTSRQTNFSWILRACEMWNIYNGSSVTIVIVMYKKFIKSKTFLLSRQRNKWMNAWMKERKIGAYALSTEWFSLPRGKLQTINSNLSHENYRIRDNSQ